MFGQTSGILANRVLLTAVLAWMAAGGAKVLLTIYKHRAVVLSRFFGSGGMPSSHSAFVSGLATAVGIALGFHSVEFAITSCLAIVVMYDAAGVRRAAGKQAALLNQIMHEVFEEGQTLTNERLKELLGHTPFEVVVGALVGILVAVLVM